MTLKRPAAAVLEFSAKRITWRTPASWAAAITWSFCAPSNTKTAFAQTLFSSAAISSAVQWTLTGAAQHRETTQIMANACTGPFGRTTPTRSFTVTPQGERSKEWSTKCARAACDREGWPLNGERMAASSPFCGSMRSQSVSKHKADLMASPETPFDAAAAARASGSKSSSASESSSDSAAAAASAPPGSSFAPAPASARSAFARAGSSTSRRKPWTRSNSSRAMPLNWKVGALAFAPPACSGTSISTSRSKNLPPPPPDSMLAMQAQGR
mmetsp:Transcript_24856/g.85169  ORF Transcript_24856/g.85169 Transcript_24856/m.85169 type:complete len:270 (-) Transcript_24856:770-1579(-)